MIALRSVPNWRITAAEQDEGVVGAAVVGVGLAAVYLASKPFTNFCTSGRGSSGKNGTVVSTPFDRVAAELEEFRRIDRAAARRSAA